MMPGYLACLVLVVLAIWGMTYDPTAACYRKQYRASLAQFDALVAHLNTLGPIMDDAVTEAELGTFDMEAYP